MTRIKLLSAALIAAAVLATPAMAREGYATSRHVAQQAHASAAPAPRVVDGQVCYPAPRVGAFATQPWDNETPCEPAQGY